MARNHKKGKKRANRTEKMKVIVESVKMKVKSEGKKKISPYDFEDKLCEILWTDIVSVREEKLRDIKNYDESKALAQITDWGRIVFVNDYFISIASSIGEGRADVTNIPISNIHQIREIK